MLNIIILIKFYLQTVLVLFSYPIHLTVPGIYDCEGGLKLGLLLGLMVG